MQEPQEMWVRSLGWEDPLKMGVATQSSILNWRIPKDRGAGRATVHRVAKSQTQLKQLSIHKCTIQTGSKVPSSRKLDMNDSPGLPYFQVDYRCGMDFFMSMSKRCSVEGVEWRGHNIL